jgi:RimJ/RimL family protein N-acetyltransferase
MWLSKWRKFMPKSHVTSDDRLRLRLFNELDVDNFYEAAKESSEQLMKWFEWYNKDYSRENAEKFICSRKNAWDMQEEFSFLIEEKHNNRFVGVIGLNRIDMVNKLANIGYWIRTSAAGKGYATAALQLLARYSFERLGFIRLEILCLPNNLPSIRVAEKAGFKREGILRKRLMLRDISNDVVLLSLLQEDIK